MTLDAFGTETHFWDHMAPIWQALPDHVRGDAVAPRPMVDHARGLGIVPGPGDINRPVLVASWGDYKKARQAGRTGIVYLEHGAGQSYDGDPRSKGASGYSGGRGHTGDGLYLVPNEYSARHWRASYPRARIEVVGCPKLDTLPRRDSGHEAGVVAISFHWSCAVTSESGTAFAHHRPGLPGLRDRFRLIGHGHPRALFSEPWLRQSYQRLNIHREDHFTDVCRLADVYVCDNSSSLFEFAATGRPVVVLNHPGYRKHIDHGGRFWDWATVGIQVERPEDLPDAVALALEDPPEVKAERERVIAEVYPYREGGAERAVAAIADWLGERLEVAA